MHGMRFSPDATGREPMIATEPIDILVRKLSRRDVISAEEHAAIARHAPPPMRFKGGVDLVSEGDMPTSSTLLVEGFAIRYRVLHGGERQITSVHVPGDFIDLHSFVLKKMDHSVGALSDCVVIQYPHEGLERITERYPHMTRMLWLMSLLDGAIHREWIVAMGRKSAAERMAHLLCELNVRLGVVGLSHDDSFSFPITQAELADLLGLSTVHINRVVQQLRAAELVRWQGHSISILDWPRLQDMTEFDPSYLHLERLRR